MTTARLAASLEEMEEKFKYFRTAKGKAVAASFVPDPTDIFITPYAKSGTTWVQQIVHSLRTRGDMDFDEIMEVIPWLSMAYDTGIDIHAPQKAHPRAFKAHYSWDQVPKGARYIYIVRDPKDVAVSEYHFIASWVIDPDAVSLTEFVQYEYLQTNGYWQHVNSWWSQFENPNVLFLCFEDMKADLETGIRQIADFMHISLDDALLRIVRRNASFEFMKAHHHQFDDHLLQNRRNEAMSLPRDTAPVKIKDGQIGSHKQQLPPDIIAEFDTRWRTVMSPAYGLINYDVVRSRIHQRRGNGVL